MPLTDEDREAIESINILEKAYEAAKDDATNSIKIAAAWIYFTGQLVEKALEQDKDPDELTAEEWLEYQEATLEYMEQLGVE